MPNTEPALDSVALVAYVLERGARTPLDIAVAGAITKDRRGESLAPMAEMAALGVRLFTDDGVGVQDPSVMRRALTYAKPLGVRLAQHCEDEALAAGGTMNEGALSGRLGLRRTPGAGRRADGAARHRTRAPDRMPAALLAPLHAVDRWRWWCGARDEGLPVSFEVAPHHFTLDESACADLRSGLQGPPAAASARDVEALGDALRPRRGRRRGERSRPARARTEGPAPSTRRRPGCSVSSTRRHSPSKRSARRPIPRTFFRVLSRGPARIAQLRREDDPRATQRARGSDGRPARTPTSRSSIRRLAGASIATRWPVDR